MAHHDGMATDRMSDGQFIGGSHAIVWSGHRPSEHLLSSNDKKKTAGVARR